MIRIGSGFDMHRLVKGRPLILGGVHVPHSHGLEGHSDADVLVHALCDALLGAAALGDLGRHFPDDDAAWQDADSIALLEQVAAKLRAAGFEPRSFDTTVVAETPRLAGHIDRMRANMARACGIGIGTASVKATTTEGLDACGRREGIAAHAVAIVEQDFKG